MVQTETASPAFSLGWIIYVLLGIVIALIVLRGVLKALAANSGASFTAFVDTVTRPLVAPFQGIFGTPHSSKGGVFELSSVVAVVVYALIAWVVVRLFALAGRRRTTTTY